MNEQESLLKVQEILLECNLPENIAGLIADARKFSLIEGVNSSFGDIIRPDDHTVDVILGNVDGKSWTSLALANCLKMQLARYANPIFRLSYYEQIKSWKKNYLTISDIVTKVYQELAEIIEELQLNPVIFYGRFNLLGNSFEYINTGFDNFIYFNSVKKEYVEIPMNNLPYSPRRKTEYVEDEKNFIYELSKFYFNSNDLFIFLDNGFFNKNQSTNSIYNKNELIKTISTLQESSLSEILNAVENSFFEFLTEKAYKHNLNVMLFKVEKVKLSTILYESDAKFLSDMSLLTAVREFIQQACLRGLGNTERLGSMMQLAITEIFTNIVRHAYDMDPHQQVDIHCTLFNNGIGVTISDKGKSFDPSTISYPSFSGDKEGGFGWYLVEKIIGTISYFKKKEENGWNRLVLFKQYIFYDKDELYSYYIEDRSLIAILQFDALNVTSTTTVCKEIDLLCKKNDIHSVVLNMVNIQFADYDSLILLASTLGKMYQLKLIDISGGLKTILKILRMDLLFDTNYVDSGELL